MKYLKYILLKIFFWKSISSRKGPKSTELNKFVLHAEKREYCLIYSKTAKIDKWKFAAVWKIWSSYFEQKSGNIRIREQKYVSKKISKYFKPNFANQNWDVRIFSTPSLLHVLKRPKAWNPYFLKIRISFMDGPFGKLSRGCDIQWYYVAVLSFKA